MIPVAVIIGAGFITAAIIAVIAAFLEPRLTRAWSWAGMDDGGKS